MSTERIWFHIVVSTYGSWLPGDPRGFRTRQHREHVEGDYKSPPPAGIYELRHDHAQRSLKQQPVVLSPTLREVVGSSLRDRLQQEGGRILIISVSGQHSHIQTQLDDGDARIPVGLAKRHATYLAHDAGFTGILWARRCKVIRIRERAHQQHVYRYILKHRAEGAWVWSELESKNEEAQG